MDKGIWHYGKDTAFKSNDARTKRIAKLGGMASGETRYLKALRRKRLLLTMADIAYCDYLVSVTEEELKAFIKWRRKQGTDSPIAEARIKDDDKESSHRYALTLINGSCFTKRHPTGKSIRELFAESQEDYDAVKGVINRAIFKMMEDMERDHFDIYKYPRGYSTIRGFKDMIAKK